MDPGPRPGSTVTNLPQVTIDAEGDRAFPQFTREDFLREEWRRTGLKGDPPAVDLIEIVREGPTVDGLAPWNRKFVECLTEAGFPPESIDENGIQFVTPPEQQDAFNLADYTCNAQYSMDLSRMQPYNEKQIRMVYDWIVAETIPCYERNGHTVTGVPTKEAFADEWFASRRHWVPEDGVDGEVTARCSRSAHGSRLQRFSTAPADLSRAIGPDTAAGPEPGRPPSRGKRGPRPADQSVGVVEMTWKAGSS